jgi:hypothetical protein
MTVTVAIMCSLLGLALGGGIGWGLTRRAFHLRLGELSRALERAQCEARTDTLTALANRKGFDEHLAVMTAIARRYGSGLALVLFDVDGLKQINDRHGHAATNLRSSCQTPTSRGRAPWRGASCRFSARAPPRRPCGPAPAPPGSRPDRRLSSFSNVPTGRSMARNSRVEIARWCSPPGNLPISARATARRGSSSPRDVCRAPRPE